MYERRQDGQAEMNTDAKTRKVKTMVWPGTPTGQATLHIVAKHGKCYQSCCSFERRQDEQAEQYNAAIQETRLRCAPVRQLGKLDCTPVLSITLVTRVVVLWIDLAS